MKRSDLLAAALRYLDRWLPHRAETVASLASQTVRPGEAWLDESLCREVADHFARQPRLSWDADLRHRYAQLQTESLRQYEAIEESGIRVEPWLGAGQPYRGSRHLIEAVLGTGTLFVFLTRDGHGPGPDPGPHPMRSPSGICRSSVEMSHNDIFRAVHDAFGHVMLGCSMGPVGELRAAYCQMAMHSDLVQPVLFSEQVSQICWFFYGPHLRSAGGRLPRRGEPGWVPPADRPYAEQKVFPCPPSFVARFKASFAEESHDFGHPGTGCQPVRLSDSQADLTRLSVGLPRQRRDDPEAAGGATGHAGPLLDGQQ